MARQGIPPGAGELGAVDAQSSLRRVATLVARGAAPADVFSAVAEEVSKVLNLPLVEMCRYESDGTATVVGATGDHPFQVGTRWTLDGASLTALVRRTERPARIDDYAEVTGPIGDAARASGVHSGVGAPVVVDGRVWGVVSAGGDSRVPLPIDAEVRLNEFTELVATAIANTQAREELRRLAEEQAALRRVATLVAHGAPPPAIFAAVAKEIGELLPADLAVIGRYAGDGAVTALAGWSRAGEPVHAGGAIGIGGRSVTALVFESGRPARLDSHDDTTAAGAGSAHDVRSSVGAPVVVEGRLWGVMVVASTDERILPTHTEERLADFTELVATAIANAEAHAELTASRARVVATADETRRRIERDLHDGTQQRLVSATLQLRAAQAAVPPDLPELAEDLNGVATGLDGALEELREFARGIHPAILAEGGLAPALRALVRRSAVPVQLEPPPGGRLPERIEVAAYFVVSEALANAAKHARSSRVTVAVAQAGDVLRVRVEDDGVGGADLGRGSGIVGLKDRVEALGGRLTLRSEPGAGTSITVDLPLAGDSR